VECPYATLALGGQFKVTLALGRERRAFLSHHLGDLDGYEAYRSYTEAITHYEKLLAIKPELIVHDLHPDYSSTQYAHERCTRDGLNHLAVQHHHAHMASCMAEHGLDEPVIGVVFDGTGYGTDGAIWGGEFLVGDLRGFRRAAHLRYVPMPGGDQAVREPWRMAVAHLADARERGDASVPTARDLLEGHVPSTAIDAVERMVGRGFQAPLTSSAGRLFDAVAALAGVRHRVSYEGQAAMELEWMASELAPRDTYPFDLVDTPEGDPPRSGLIVDTRPLTAGVARDAVSGLEPSIIARKFHTTLVELVAQVCRRLGGDSGLNAVLLSGGVFMNALLSSEVTARLAADDFRVYCHHRVPPNDGGLSLGQLAVAARLAADHQADLSAR
jgi:hydrogenase maturation protein HypF